MTKVVLTLSSFIGSYYTCNIGCAELKYFRHKGSNINCTKFECASNQWLTRGVLYSFQIQSDHFEEFLAPELDKHGYQALFKRKTAEVC